VTDSKVFNLGQCYCSPAWQGVHCEKKNPWVGEEARRVDKAFYQLVGQVEELGEGVELLWRVEGEEVELVVSAPTTSWVGLGWRPLSSTKACQKFPAHLSTPRGRDFNGMDCTDMVVGSARSGLSRVGDYYTRDRSTPRRDGDWGGEDDLVAAHAWEEEGRTTVRVVRRVQGGVSDHPLKGQLHVIWAYGQTSEFYKEDQLKYHGRGNRGAAFLDLGGQ